MTSSNIPLPFPEFRNTDPATSKAGIGEKQRGKDVLKFTRAVASYPDCTVAELARHLVGNCKLNKQSPKNAETFSRVYRTIDKASKRLSDAYRKRYISVSDSRKCSITHRTARTFRVTDKGLKLIWLNPEAR